jgi:hypothetical protein
VYDIFNTYLYLPKFAVLKVVDILVGELDASGVHTPFCFTHVPVTFLHEPPTLTDDEVKSCHALLTFTFPLPSVWNTNTTNPPAPASLCIPPMPAGATHFPLDVPAGDVLTPVNAPDVLDPA